MDAGFSLAELQVDHRRQPLDVETAAPCFSWRLVGNQRGLRQSAYQIRVYHGDRMVWNSGRVHSAQTGQILYEGHPLCPCGEYRVEVTVWNQEEQSAHASTFFETGMMDGSLTAWEGARWLGPSRCSLYSFTKEVFSVQGELRIPPGSSKAGLVLGGEDPRLKDANLNPFGLAGRNYIAYELDVSVLPAVLRIYRVGYDPKDREEIPLAEHSILPITADNRHEFHTLRIDVLGHEAYAYLDGTCIDWEVGPQGEKIPRQLNPLGRFDVPAFPMLCQVGFEAAGGSWGEFRRLTLRNLRTPKALLFEATPDAPGPFAAVEPLKVEPNRFCLNGDKNRTLALADPSHGSMPVLRRRFSVAGGLTRARLYITARGIYQGKVNGAALSQDWFQPGANQFDKHLDYQIYDLTEKLFPGENAMAFVLGSGWWSDAQTYVIQNHNYFGDRPALLAKLVLEYPNGGRQEVVTGPEDWKLSVGGPMVYAGNFHGEVYDARREAAFAGCSLPQFDDGDWEQPAVLEAVPVPETEQVPGWPAPNHTQPEFTAWNSTPVRAGKVLKAKSVAQPRPGVFVYDMGQNMAGVPRIRLRGNCGQRFVFRFGEMLYPSNDPSGMGGMLLTENLRVACCTDHYISKGDPKGETFQPRFTFHGYRYLELTGTAAPPKPEEVEGIVLSSMTEQTGSFTCSEPLVNRLFENVLWSQRANSISIPTDCPQRNERLGWMGDAQVFAPTACFNADMRQFYRRFLRAARDLQTPQGQYPNIAPVGGGFGGIAWESAGIIVTWAVYRQYGDLEIIRENYTAMKRYIQYLKTKGWPGILTDVGPLGDWLATDLSTDLELLWNAVFAYDVKILGQMAAAIGETEDAAEYQSLFEEICALWNRTFVDAQGYTQNRAGERNDTQCSYALPLEYGVFSAQNAPKAALCLAQRVERDGYTVTCGFLGTPHLNPALCRYGYTEAAYRLLLQKEYPSWLYPVLQGATTVWERWNSYTLEHGFGGNNGMNSFNHYSLGAVAAWLYEFVLGIGQEEGSVGFEKLAFRPRMEVLESAAGYYDTPSGRAAVDWKREGGKIFLKILAPPNTGNRLPAQRQDAGMGRRKNAGSPSGKPVFPDQRPIRFCAFRSTIGRKNVVIQ